MSGSSSALRHSRIATAFVIFTLILAVLPLSQITPPAAAQDTATYTLTKYNCNPGYDPSSGDANAAFSNCTTPASGVTFTLQSGDASYGNNGAQQTNGSGSASWSGIPLGSGYSIVESIPQGGGDPWVYCEVSGNPNDSGDVQRSFFQASGGNMDVGYSDPNLTSYTQANCTWFNPTAAQGQKPQNAAYLYKFYCDENFDWQNGGYDYLASGCTSRQSNVLFKIENGGYSQQQTTDNNGAASWIGVPDGNLKWTETAPDGYQIGRIFCGYSNDSNTAPTTWDEYTYSNGWNVSTQSGKVLFCFVFDVPSTNTTVYLYKFYCDSSFDWQNGGYDYLLSGCQNPQSGVDFQIVNGSYAASQTTDSGGTATWGDVPAGNLSLSEKAPDGYQVGRIFCGYSDSSSSAPSSWDEYSYSSGWDVSTQSGKYLFCVIFDVPSTTTDYGTIYIFKYYCDASFDWENGGYDYLFSGCPNAQSGVEFSVESGSYAQSQTTDASGIAAWTDVPSGPATFLEGSTSGYTVGRVFCGVSTDANTVPSQMNEVSYSDGSSVQLESGQYLYCVVFDIPTTTNWTVYLYKFYCDPSFDWQNGGYDYLYSGCQNVQSDVEFDLGSGSYSSSQTTDSGGSATWSDVPQGDVHFDEHMPDGYQVGRIFCAWSDSNSAPSSWDEYSYSAGWDVPSSSSGSGTYLFCVIFDVPTTNTTVYLYKYYCDASFDWQNGGYDYLYSGCTSPQENVAFDLSNSGGYSQSQTTDTSGFASWSDVPLDDMHFDEHMPDGYQIGRIFCGWSDSDSSPPSSWDEYSYNSGWDVPSDSHQYLYCVIFDVPTTYGWVTIYKYYCDADFDWHNGGYDYLYSGCTSPQSDVEFTIESGSYSQSQTTDSSGMASWSDVPGSSWHISESEPSGYQVGRVFCGWSDSDSSAPTSWDEYSYSSGWDMSSSSGQYLYCYIFDVPTTYGWVTFYKYYCDDSYDWQSSSYDELSSNCSSPQSDVEFDLSSGSSTESQTTDSSGMAQWTDVPGNNWHFDEHVPDGYQIGRVFCGWSDSESSEPTSWDEYSYSSGWNVSNSPGQYLYCVIFDVPTTYGWVTIYKYNCPSDFDYASAEQSYYRSSCTEQPQGVEFDLSNSSWGYDESQSTDSSGIASWSDVPSGSGWNIHEYPSSGYAPIAVWCGTSSDGSDPSSWTQYSLSGDGGLSGMQVESGSYLVCIWFNKPYDDPQVWIYKYNCDSSADWHWSYHQLLTNCTTPGTDVAFAYGEEGGDSNDSTTDNQGRVSYDALSEGTWWWQESYPSGYDGAVVYCQWVNSWGSGEYQEAQLYDSVLWLDVSSGDVVTCYWFDFPSGHSPTSGNGGSGNTNNGSGSSGGTGGSTSGGNTSGGSGGSGGTSTPPPPLTSNVPTGTSTGPGTVGGGSTTGQQGDPNAPATLIIIKSTCPDGYDIYADKADVTRDCTDLTKDIDFDLTSLTVAMQNGSPVPNEPVSQTTGDDGTATWTNLKAGPYVIVEAMPEGTHSAFIWTCKSDKRQFQAQYPFTPFSYAGPDGQLGITLIGGEKLECTWYDIPVGTATVTITKFDCPSSPVIVAQCQPSGAGIAFSLTPAQNAGAILQLTTDDTGAATADGVAGAYTLAEQGGTPCLIDSDAIDAQGHVTLTEGQTAEIKVYNCGNGS